MKRLKINIYDFLPCITIAVLVLVFSITSQGKLLTLFNLKAICTQSVPVIIGGLGVMFIVAMGSTDLSVGAVAAVSATVSAYIGCQYGLWAMLPVSIVIGLVCGLFLGMVVSRFRVSSFMASLAMLICLRGFQNVLLVKWQQVYIPKGLTAINSFTANIIILILLVVIFGYIFECTSFGYYCKGMGENENTMKSIGLDTTRIRHIAFIISGLTASIMGIVLISSVGGSSSTLGQFMEMKIQMAIFLGGVLVTGGMKSKMYKLILGSLSITVIVNGLIISGANGATAEAVEGILMMLILFLTIKMSKLNQRDNKKKNTAGC
jgi:Ribose/xylose/arabinose/galactoside ABC-type transport systems, permease components